MDTKQSAGSYDAAPEFERYVIQYGYKTDGKLVARVYGLRGM